MLHFKNKRVGRRGGRTYIILKPTYTFRSKSKKKLNKSRRNNFVKYIETYCRSHSVDFEFGIKFGILKRLENTRPIRILH